MADTVKPDGNGKGLVRIPYPLLGDWNPTITVRLVSYFLRWRADTYMERKFIDKTDILYGSPSFWIKESVRLRKQVFIIWQGPVPRLLAIPILLHVPELNPHWGILSGRSVTINHFTQFWNSILSHFLTWALENCNWMLELDVPFVGLSDMDGRNG